jgi:hypothetical protein
MPGARGKAVWYKLNSSGYSSAGRRLSALAGLALITLRNEICEAWSSATYSMKWTSKTADAAIVA